MQFFNKMYSLIEFISKNTSDGMVYEIGINPVISKSLQVQGIKLFNVVKDQVITNIAFFILNITENKFSDKTITFTSFEDYIIFRNNYVVIEAVGTQCSSSCKMHLKDYVCSYSIAISIALGFIIPPIKSNMYSIPISKSVGRPKRVPSALEFDK